MTKLGNISQLKASVRSHAGSRHVAFKTVYDDLLCCDCVCKNFRRCAKAITHKELGWAWTIISCDIPSPGSECDNCDEAFL